MTTTEVESEGGRNGSAVERWKILKRAILGAADASRPSSKAKNVDQSRSPVLASVRSFSTFGLFDVSHLRYEARDESGDVRDRGRCEWLRYSYRDTVTQDVPYPTTTPAPKLELTASIRHLPPRTSLEAMTGFNNTGNVCVWPSEEVLAWYCLEHRDQFEDKSVCELGGGMTALAGVMLSLTTLPTRIQLTDGNETSVENIHRILEENGGSFASVSTLARVLLWNEEFLESHHPKFDFVICADCLFFTELHDSLAKVIHKLLDVSGRAILFNPRRNGTLDQFVTVAEELFVVEKIERYDEAVWRKHCAAVMMTTEGENGAYKPDLHYPILLILQPLSGITTIS